jgi:sigma-B regulation protein RsbU (phosphoserine phosphatase)
MIPMSPRVRPARSSHRSVLQEELASLHQSALPRLEQVPESFDLACWVRPAQTIGGDLLAAWPIDESRLLVCLADVMGHGIPAAVVASAVRAGLYEMERTRIERPALVLDGLNRLVCGLFEGYFVTASACLLDAAEGSLTFAQAGHPAILLRDLDGGVTYLSSPALPLGLDAEESYSEQTMALEPGVAVVLYSDGVIEALSSAQMTGSDILSTLVGACRRPAAFRIIQRIRRAVRRSSPIRHDDRTALAVRILPLGE